MTQHNARRPWRALLLAGIAALTLAACSAGSDSASSLDEMAPAYATQAGGESAAAPATREAQGDQAAEAPAADLTREESGAGAEGAGTSGLDPTAVAVDRQVIRTATVAVGVEVATTGDDDADDEALRNAVTDAALKVRGLVGTEGYVSASDSSGRVAVITLRIPATGYQAAVEGLSAIGEVTSLQEQAQDVTAQMVDLESRIKTMTASVDRVRALLAQATDLDDVVSLESELARREADLESIQQQQAVLAGQAALSTVTVTLTGVVTGLDGTVADEPAEESTGFLGGLAKGWDAFLGFGAAVLAVIGALLPFIPVVVVAVLLGRLVFRIVSRRTAPVATAAGPAPLQPHPASHDGDEVSR